MHKKICIIGIVLITLVSIAGCIADLGTGQEAKPVKVTIADLVNTPEKYGTNNLSVEGTVSSQCGSGCWFILSDNTGDLYVNLKPNNFVIPPAMGKKVEVNGTILVKSGDVAFIGSSVDLEGKHYP